MPKRSDTRAATRRPLATVVEVRQAPPDARRRLESVRPLVLPALVLVVMTVAAFAPVVNAGYVWDDGLYVTGNPHLKDAAGLVDMWFRFGSTTMYAPAVFTTLWVEHQLWGLNPLGYHLVNLALHVACVLLLWAVFRGLGVRGAWLAAALFGVHPVMVESVAWVVELKNVQSAFFSLLALLAYMRYSPLDGTPPPGVRTRRVSYLLALLLFAVALLSKPVVVTLPPTVLILIWWKRGRVEKGDVLSVAPFLAMGLAAALLAVHVEHRYGGATGAAWQLSAPERILVAGRAVWFYAAKLAWPVNLLSIYPRWRVRASAWWQYIYPVGAAALVGVLWYWRRRFGRGPLAAVLSFGMLVSPLVGIFNVAYHLYSFVADHFQYHAAPALLALFASGVIGLRSWNGRALGRAVDIGSGVLLLVLATLTSRHVQTFRDEKTRCLRTIEGNPAAWSAMYNLGLQLKTEGDPRGALHWYARALELTPGNPEVLNNAGVAQMSLGDTQEAVRNYREALRLAPAYALAHDNLAGALAALGDRRSAIREYEEALRIEPDLAEARRDLAKVLAAEGRVEDAVREFREALRIRPDDADAHHNLGVTLDRAGRSDEAVREFREALRLSPADAAILRDLASALAHAGKLGDAIGLYEEALRLAPGDAEAHNGLALARAWAGQPDEAAREFSASLRLDPGYADAHSNFGTLLLSQGRLPEAIAHYEQAVRLGPGSARAHAGLGTALASAGRLDAAVAELREAVRLEPASAENHEMLGVGLAQTGRLSEAIAELQRALEIDPGSASARKNLDLARGARGGGSARR
jgi:protein O-mannosyl-transferase